MKQIKSLLLLRSNQCYRYLDEIGFGFILVAIFLLTGLILSALQNILSIPAIGAILLSFALLIYIEIKRGDSFFLKSIFESRQSLITYKFIENILIALPIIIFQSVFLKWDIIAYIVLICGIVPLLPFHLINSKEKERKRELNIIPLQLFEIKFYFEKQFWTVVFFGLLLLMGCVHISLWIVGILVICMLPGEIYMPLESREMLKYTPHFVAKKIKSAAFFFLLLITIPTITTYIFNTADILILLYGVIAMLLSLTLCISKKYVAFYGVTESVPSTTSTIILILLMLAPGGILITLSACIYYYIKAEKHMKNTYATI